MNSKEIWIIQVYVDGDEYCEEFASFWEEAARYYGHTVKFGRINAHTHPAALRFLPIGIQIFPTILSWNNQEDQETEILGMESLMQSNKLSAIERFIDKIVGQPVPTMSVNEFITFNNANNNSISTKWRKPAIFYLKGGKLPLDYRYAFYKYREEFSLTASSQASFQGISQVLNNSEANKDILVYYDEPVHGEKTGKYIRHVQAFNFRKQVKSRDLFSVFTMAKMLTIPKVDRHGFDEFCHAHINSPQDGADDSTTYAKDEGAINPTLCVLILNPKEDILTPARATAAHYFKEAASNLADVTLSWVPSVS